jgi:hypothetical protein
MSRREVDSISCDSVAAENWDTADVSVSVTEGLFDWVYTPITFLLSSNKDSVFLRITVS